MNIVKLREQKSFEDFDINIKDLIDKVCIGPQAGVVEQLKRFNSNYGSSLALTRRFNFKPGSYKKIKDLYTSHVLRWDMKPRGIKSIFERISSYRWRGRNLRTNLLDLENSLSLLRRNGTIWQDNTEDIGEELQRLKDHVSKEVALASKHYETMTCETLVSGYKYNDRHYSTHTSADRLVPLNDDSITDFSLYFLVKFSGGIMKHIHLRSNGMTTTDVPIPGDVYMVVSIKLIPMLSNAWKTEYDKLNANPGDSYTDSAFRMDPIYVSAVGKHPYISGHLDPIGWNINDGDVDHRTNACTGNMASDIRKAFYNGKIYLGIAHLYNWLHNYYVPQTYPINRIVQLYRYGSPEPLWKLKDSDTIASLKERTIENCEYVSQVPENATKFARVPRVYGTGFSISTDKRIEYFNKYDFNQAPCHQCTFIDKCSKVKDLTMVLLDDRTEETEAILGIFMEYSEILVRNYGTSRLDYIEDLLKVSYGKTTFLEELKEKDLEYLMYIAQCYYTNSRDKHIELRNIFRDIRVILADDIKRLIEENDYSEDSLNNAIENYHYKLRKEDEENLNIDTAEEQHREIDEAFLASLPEVPIEEVTPEEATLRWATRIGGAHNL